MSTELIVVPNDGTDIWIKKLDKNARHGKAIFEYALTHNINLTKEIVGDIDETYNGYLWGTALAKLGQVSLLVDEYLVIHVPEELSDNQYQFFYNHYKFIERYNDNVASCFIKTENGEQRVYTLMKEEDTDFEVSPVKLFYNELDKVYKSKKIR